jgi:hypothetical protein
MPVRTRKAGKISARFVIVDSDAPPLLELQEAAFDPDPFTGDIVWQGDLVSANAMGLGLPPLRWNEFTQGFSSV